MGLSIPPLAQSSVGPAWVGNEKSDGVGDGMVYGAVFGSSWAAKGGLKGALAGVASAGIFWGVVDSLLKDSNPEALDKYLVL